MAEQDFQFKTKYITWKENITFGFSIPLICLFTAFLFQGQGNLLFLFAFSSVLAITISAVNIIMLRSLSKWYRFNSLRQRIITHGSGTISFAALVAVISGYIVINGQDLSFTEALKFTFTAGFLVCLSNTVYALVYYTRFWYENIMHTEALKREIMHTQIEGVRQQLSPHFFFNSLNSLTLVIEENPEEAIKYVNHIAHMYRYLLQNKEAKTVLLNNELRFAESYIYLQKMRFGKALDMTISIDKADRQTLVPPMTLYILLENALMHNIITKAKPLHINVFISEGKLQISNNIQARHLPEENPVIGLKTIRSCYESISVQPLQIIQDDKNFTVALPLIKGLSQTA